MFGKLRLMLIGLWGVYPIAYLFPVLGSTARTPFVAKQAGYTVADILAKAAFGLVIYKIARVKSQYDDPNLMPPALARPKTSPPSPPCRTVRTATVRSSAPGPLRDEPVRGGQALPPPAASATRSTYWNSTCSVLVLPVALSVLPSAPVLPTDVPWPPRAGRSSTHGCGAGVDRPWDEHLLRDRCLVLRGRPGPRAVRQCPGRGVRLHGAGGIARRRVGLLHRPAPQAGDPFLRVGPTCGLKLATVGGPVPARR